MVPARADAKALFERGLAQATAYRQADAEHLLRRALTELERRPEAGGLSRERVLISLANVRAERGHASEGMQILDSLVGRVSGELLGLVHSQRGLLQLRTGRVAEAMVDLNAAVGLIATDSRALAAALLNRGWLNLSGGELEAARSDLERCIQVAGAAGLVRSRAKARHNLAYLAFLGGDLPSALAGMEAAHAQLLAADQASGTEPAVDAVYHLDRARVLFTVGLVREADADLEIAAAAFAARGSRQDQAECELGRAQVAMADRPEHAARMADRARRRFERRGATAWAHLAELLALRARFSSGRPAARIADAADRLVPLLRGDGLAEDARVAALLAIAARVAAGGAEAAARAGRGIRVGQGDGILTRLYARQVRAEVSWAAGRTRAAKAQLRAGLEELHRYQASFGSIDLQTAVARHGRALAKSGVAAALVSGRAAEVFAWSERARALASRLPPVRPPRDPEAAELLERLRFVRAELRAVELAGRDEPRLRAVRADLERQIRRRSWFQPGPGDIHVPVTLTEARAALRDHDSLVVHLVSGRDLYVLVVTAARATVLPLGDIDGLLETLRRTRADLDALAVRGLPDPIRRTVLRSATRNLDRLDARLWARVDPLQGSGSLVLIPSGALTGVPWPMLPRLRGRPLTVARTATSWIRAQGQAHNQARGGSGMDRVPPDGGQVVLAAGPDLVRAEPEVREAGELWRGSRVMVGASATGSAVRAAMVGADLLHLAAHGTYEPDNPLFSSVHLADGPLFGYDLTGLTGGSAPGLVILSACDLGLATERPGDELLGMTAVLLQAGTRCVVASVAGISDEVARTVLVDFHGRLHAGRSPAQALAEVTQNRIDAPFVCFGAGS